jgi:hypothetical protein
MIGVRVRCFLFGVASAAKWTSKQIGMWYQSPRVVARQFLVGGKGEKESTV